MPCRDWDQDDEREHYQSEAIEARSARDRLVRQLCHACSMLEAEGIELGDELGPWYAEHKARDAAAAEAARLAAERETLAKHERLAAIRARVLAQLTPEEVEALGLRPPQPTPSEPTIRHSRGVELKAGYNVDRVDVAAGLRELAACGYTEPETRMVIEYALNRWARGEEEAAERGAIDRSFHGINFGSWRRVLAAAVATATVAAEKEEASDAST